MLGMHELLRLVVVVQIMGSSASGDVVCDVNRSFFPSLLYLGKPDLKKIKIFFFGMHFLLFFLVR